MKVDDKQKDYKRVNRGKPFEIDVDGEKILAYKGETIAAALLATSTTATTDPSQIPTSRITLAECSYGFGETICLSLKRNLYF